MSMKNEHIEMNKGSTPDCVYERMIVAYRMIDGSLM